MQDIGRTYNRVDIATNHIFLHTDTSRPDARGMKRQLSFLLLIMDDEGKASIVHDRSAHCKRVTGSVMVSEVHALVLDFDEASSKRRLLEVIMNRKLSRSHRSKSRQSST